MRNPDPEALRDMSNPRKTHGRRPGGGTLEPPWAASNTGKLENGDRATNLQTPMGGVEPRQTQERRSSGGHPCKD
jgi:hypothetical protein